MSRLVLQGRVDVIDEAQGHRAEGISQEETKDRWRFQETALDLSGGAFTLELTQFCIKYIVYTFMHLLFF